MDGERYIAIGLVFFIILGIACIGKSCSDQASEKRQKEQEFQEYLEWGRKEAQKAEERDKQALRQLEESHRRWIESGGPERARRQWLEQQNQSQDETDAMNRLSDIYDGYMDYDDYDANMESTGNPEEDDIISYESFVEGDAGEWERLEEGEWE